MTEKTLQNKVCIVTGAAGGMGRELALKYAQLGADLALLDINQQKLEETAAAVRQLGVQALVVTADFADMASVNHAFDQIEKHYPQINILANCAGISTSKLLLEVADAEWDRVFNINLKSLFVMSARAAKNMIRHQVKHGRIVSISSQASKVGELGNGVYSVSKAGVNMLTQVLGLELAEHGIAVTAVCPGYVNTDMMQQVFQKRGPIEGMTAAAYEKSLTDKVPLKRMAEAGEIADLMVFLSSEQAGYITGVTITIAGGKTLI